MQVSAGHSSVPENDSSAADGLKPVDFTQRYSASRLLPVTQHAFPEMSAVKDLYRAALDGGPAQFYEGEAVESAVLTFVSSLRDQGHRRCSDEEVLLRLGAIYSCASELFTRVPDAEALVLYGSFLRGKPLDDVGDVDLRIVTPFEQKFGWEPLDPWIPTFSIEQVEAGINQTDLRDRKIMGRPLQILFNSDFSNTNGTGLNYMLNGPFLAMVPERNECGELVGLAVFFSDKGEEYRRDRKP